MKHHVMYPFVVLILALSLLFVSAGLGITKAEAQVIGTNLIVNGNFEAGNTGFNTDYTYSPGNLYPDIVYDVLTNPRNAHPAATSYGDHTSGAGKKMAINGSITTGNNPATERKPTATSRDPATARSPDHCTAGRRR